MARLSVPVNKLDHIKGPIVSMVSLVEYGDYLCPHSAAAHEKLRRIATTFGVEFQFVFRHFPVNTLHEHSFLAAKVSEAAGKQGKFWQMHDLIFSNQTYFSPDRLTHFASALYLDLERFSEDLRDSKLTNKIRGDYMGGLRSGVATTPTFFMNGQRFEGPLEPIDFLDRMSVA